MTSAKGSPIRTAWNGNAETRRQAAAISGGGGRIPASSFTKLIIWQEQEEPKVQQVLLEPAESPAQVQLAQVLMEPVQLEPVQLEPVLMEPVPQVP